MTTTTRTLAYFQQKKCYVGEDENNLMYAWLIFPCVFLYEIEL